VFDLFRHGGISEISMDKAASNMRSLGIYSRISFLKHDLTKPMESDAKYDLAVSNLGCHADGPGVKREENLTFPLRRLSAPWLCWY
jgi:hypothetical protein